ncbi:MAG: hypothetical protein R3F43_01720 [bacterium]
MCFAPWFATSTATTFRRSRLDALGAGERQQDGLGGLAWGVHHGREGSRPHEEGLVRIEGQADEGRREVGPHSLVVVGLRHELVAEEPLADGLAGLGHGRRLGRRHRGQARERQKESFHDQEVAHLHPHFTPGLRSSTKP